MEQIYYSKKFFENSSEFNTLGTKTGKSQCKSRTNIKHQSQPLQSYNSSLGASYYTTKAYSKTPYSLSKLDMEYMDMEYTIAEKSSKAKDRYYTYTTKAYGNEPYNYKVQANCRDSSNCSYHHNKRCCSTSSTQPSSEDSEVLRRTTAEGFKVVQSGNIIHDSLLSDSEGDSPYEATQAPALKWCFRIGFGGVVRSTK